MELADTATEGLQRLRTGVDRALYLLQQHSLAAAFGYGTTLWHLAMNPTRIPPKKARQTIARRLSEMFRRDYENVASGYYPREILTFPLLEYLPLAPEALSDAPR